MLDIAITKSQILLSFIEYRESNIEYLLVKRSEANDKRPATGCQNPGASREMKNKGALQNILQSSHYLYL